MERKTGGGEAGDVTRASDAPEAREQAREQHARDVHGVKVDRELERRVLGVVHDSEDDAHRQSMGGLIP
jgi:hypothetical protein